MNLDDELVIIKKVTDGELSAFSTLVDQYKDYAVTLAYNILLNKEDAEDIAQDAFIKAFSSLSSFNGSSRFSTWFYRIVVNTALNKLKRKNLACTLSDEETTGTVEEWNDKFRVIDQRKYIQIALDRLKEAERVCITLHYLNEFSMEEIKQITGFSIANIKVLLYRGRKNLYKWLHFFLKDETKYLP